MAIIIYYFLPAPSLTRSPVSVKTKKHIFSFLLIFQSQLKVVIFDEVVSAMVVVVVYDGLCCYDDWSVNTLCSLLVIFDDNIIFLRIGW